MSPNSSYLYIYLRNNYYIDIDVYRKSIKRFHINVKFYKDDCIIRTFNQSVSFVNFFFNNKLFNNVNFVFYIYGLDLWAL